MPTQDPTVDQIDDTNVFDPDAQNQDESKAEELQPLFQIYEGARVAVSKAVGPAWKKRFDAAIAAYNATHEIWDTVIGYYNNSQDKQLKTPRGVFKRGDGTENVIFSNLNVTMPAVYSKDPDITCSTTDKGDKDFCRTLEVVINTLMRRKDKLNAKGKIKKGVGFGLLTNYGVLKLNWTDKDNSAELAAEEMQRITTALSKAKTQAEVESLYGQLEALEQNMEMAEASGPSLVNVMPHRLFVDPSAEQPDGLDGKWMIEEMFVPTSQLIARFTKDAKEDDEDENEKRRKVLIYKPTHEAVFATTEGQREDGLGMVLKMIDAGGASSSVGDVEKGVQDDRAAYINMYHTQVYLVWDKVFRRVMMFHKDDWTWPIWVWDDPLKLSRFFPYFIISFSMSTGGTVSAGETAYYLDQQDEINEINRQVARIRAGVFNYFYFNADNIDKDEASKFVEAILGKSPNGPRILGVKAGEKSIKDMFAAFSPPAIEYEALFNKEPILNTINRMTNTNDALRGVQFKTNTNEAAVNTYQDATRLSVGAKVDVVEDVVGDIALALAELCVQRYDSDDVASLVGAEYAKSWLDMDLEMFRTEYNVELVAGSMEKPNSVFKKKEAVEVAQAVGQFATAAPGATLRIMLKVLEQAFTEVVISPEDWEAIDQEIAANATKGVSTAGGGSGSDAGAGAGGGDVEAIMQQAMSLPDDVKQQIMAAHSQGATPEQLLQMIQQATAGAQSNAAES
jgi:hypothetical protein